MCQNGEGKGSGVVKVRRKMGGEPKKLLKLRKKGVVNQKGGQKRLRKRSPVGGRKSVIRKKVNGIYTSPCGREAGGSEISKKGHGRSRWKSKEKQKKEPTKKQRGKKC